MSESQTTSSTKRANRTKPVHTKPARDSSLELLRIIAMLLIIADHFSVHSGAFPSLASAPNTPDYSLHHLFILNLNMAGQVGVTCFVLISGFFLCTSKFKLSRILKIELQMLIFSILITTVIAIAYPGRVNSFTWFKAFFPTTFKTWWFATVYIVLVALSPFTNKLLKTLTRREHLALVAVLIVVMSLLPTLTNDMFVVADYLGRFIMLYCIAAYLRRYPDARPSRISPLVLIPIAAIAYVLPSLIMPLYANYDKSNPWYPLITWFLRSSPNHERMFTLIAGVCLFLAFRQFKLGNNRIVNLIAGTTFGIYLFTDQFLIRRIIWTDTVKATTHYAGNWFFLFAIATIVCVFLVGMVADLIRRHVVQTPLEKQLAKLWARWGKQHEESDKIQPYRADMRE